MNSRDHIKSLPFRKARATLRNALSVQHLLRATFTSHAQAFVSEPMALSNDPIELKAWVLGPNGPRCKVKAVQEIVVTISYGEHCV
jgi:hypothetical protein